MDNSLLFFFTDNDATPTTGTQEGAFHLPAFNKHAKGD